MQLGREEVSMATAAGTPLCLAIFWSGSWERDNLCPPSPGCGMEFSQWPHKWDTATESAGEAHDLGSRWPNSALLLLPCTELSTWRRQVWFCTLSFQLRSDFLSLLLLLLFEAREWKIIANKLGPGLQTNLRGEKRGAESRLEEALTENLPSPYQPFQIRWGSTVPTHAEDNGL